MGQLGALADRKDARVVMADASGHRASGDSEPDSHRATPYARDTGGRPVAIVQAEWVGDHRFQTGRPSGPHTLLDGDGKEAQSPVDALLSALATCAAYDVVDILAKRRTPLESMVIEVIGERAMERPRRFLHITLIFRVKGEGIDREQTERAIDLAVNKYCSVRSSLAENMEIDWQLEIEGEPPRRTDS